MRIPVLLLFLAARSLFAQVLSPGDIAVLGVSANTFACGGPPGGDEISFVCLKDIPPNFSLDITDNGFERCLPEKWGDSEGVIRFKRTGGLIPAGTVLTWRLSSTNSFGTYQFVSPDADWAIENLNTGLPPATAVNLNAGGDQLYFLSGGDWDNDGGTTGNDATYDGNILFGFNSKSIWQADCVNNSTQNSNLHPDVSPCFHMAPTTASDFSKYNGPLTPASRLEWIDRIRRPANWSFFNSCTAYAAAAPDFPNGLKIDILPTQIGISGGVPGVCPGDTVFLTVKLPSAGGPFSVIWTDGASEFSQSGLLNGDLLAVVPTTTAIYAIEGLTDANGCTIRGDLNTQFFLESYPSDSTAAAPDTTCVAAEAGVFTERLTNRYGCDSLVTRMVFFDATVCAVQGLLDFSPISCFGKNDGSFRLTLSAGLPPFDFQWQKIGTSLVGQGQIAALQQAESIQDLGPGDYRITVTDANGVSAVFSKQLAEPHSLLALAEATSDYNGFNISCFGARDGRALAKASGGTPPHQFAWSSGETSTSATMLASGEQKLGVTDANGCSAEAAFNLSAPPDLQIEATILGEDCAGKNNGEIRVSLLGGGVPPHSLRLDNQPVNGQMHWQNQSPGQHTLLLADANACEKTLDVSLPLGPVLQVDAGPDTLIFSGDTLHWQVRGAGPIDSLAISPPEFVQLMGGGSALIFPERGTLFSVLAWDSEGCLGSDTFFVRVKKTRSLYVPNVFSPAAKDFENQSFNIFADPGVEAIALFKIFDRFGAEVFARDHFAPNQLTGNWDGRIGSQDAPAGVYAWFAVVRLRDGREQVFSGDVLLLR